MISGLVDLRKPINTLWWTWILEQHILNRQTHHLTFEFRCFLPHCHGSMKPTTKQCAFKTFVTFGHLERAHWIFSIPDIQQLTISGIIAKCLGTTAAQPDSYSEESPRRPVEFQTSFSISIGINVPCPELHGIGFHGSCRFAQCFWSYNVTGLFFRGSFLISAR